MEEDALRLVVVEFRDGEEQGFLSHCPDAYSAPFPFRTFDVHIQQNPLRGKSSARAGRTAGVGQGG